MKERKQGLLNSPLYYCNHCKKLVNHLEGLLFVEDGSPRGFCSETCIEKFFGPIATHYAECERVIREHTNAQDEECLKHTNNPRFIEQTLNSPSEIWRLENALKEEVFAYIKHFGPVKGVSASGHSMIALCLVFAQRPSFIMTITATSHKDILKEFQIGEQVTDPQYLSAAAAPIEIEEQMSDEFSSSIELKKSTLLAELLERHSPADIPMEDYLLYDKFLEDTISAPDEIHSFQGPDGDLLYTYVKAHQQKGVSFYYFVICLAGPGSGLPGEEGHVAIPILSFPSVDGDIYRWCQRGELVYGGLKN